MTPDRIKPKPVDPVLAWIPQIVRKHKEGFSPRQIVAMAAAPGIDLKLSERAVQRIVAQHDKQATAQAGTPGR